MQFTEVPEVNGAFIVTTPRYHDGRGFFQEHYNAKKYEGKVKACEQVSFCMHICFTFTPCLRSAKSQKHVIRGLHCAQYGKLVQCVQGCIIDYFVDLRPESPTYMKWAAGIILLF
jgi:dTDP-4-dehydrorhamnose 3,5-epimerase